jgi:AbrB family looped-hinge helix DNA binding protein
MKQSVAKFSTKVEQSGRTHFPSPVAELLGPEIAVRMRLTGLEAPMSRGGGMLPKRWPYAEVFSQEVAVQDLQAMRGDRNQGQREDPQKEMLGRQLANEMRYAALDSGNRVTLPPEVREHLGIGPGDEVQIFALGDRVELWSAEVFKEYDKATRGEEA